MAVGYKSEATNAQATAIGPQAKASGQATIAIGNGSWATPSGASGNQIVVGDAAFAYNNMNYFIGGGAGIKHDYVVCFGCAGSSVSRTRDVSTAEHQGFLGWYSDTLHTPFQTGDGFINDWWLGGPIETANPHDITLNITDGLGINKDGVDFTINASKGTGTGTPGKILFTAANATTSGSTLQTANTVLTATGTGIATGAFSPAASLHLAAGTSSASTAPLKFTSGTNLATPENGAVEYDGTNYFATSGGTRYTLAKTLTTTSALNFTATAAQGSSDMTVTVTGAADGDAVSLGVPNSAVLANSSYTAWVSAADTVTIRFSNYSSGSINPAAGTFRISVIKY